MSGYAPIIPFDRREPDPPGSPAQNRDKARPRIRAAWFAWWVAACAVVLAVNTSHQLQTQQRLLTGSRELERIVAQSRTVSAQTNQQLARVKDLDTATRAMDDRLVKIGEVNARVKGQTAALEQTVLSVQGAVSGLDAQAAESKSHLETIIRESAALQETLRDSRRVISQVSAQLTELVRQQEAINADLLDLTDKTKLLERGE